jgi:hypothetical protein
MPRTRMYRCIDDVRGQIRSAHTYMYVCVACHVQWVLGPATACGGTDGAALSGAPRERHGGGGGCCHHAREASPPRSLVHLRTLVHLPAAAAAITPVKQAPRAPCRTQGQR